MPEDHHVIQQREEFPKGVGNVQSDDTVSIIVTEDVARAIEKNFLSPRGLQLAGPIVFGEDDTPSYILGPTRL